MLNITTHETASQRTPFPECLGTSGACNREPADPGEPLGAVHSRREVREEADDLVEGLRHGDGEAFSSLFRREGARMLAAARRLLGNDQDAEDAVQDAFLQAYRAIDRFNGESRISTWLHRIVVNASLMKLRSRRRKPEQQLDELPQLDENGSCSRPVSGWECSSDELLERAETRAMVRRAIDRLPKAYREVLIPRDIQDLDTEETAVLLGVSVNAIKVRLHRARQTLRTLLEAEFAEVGARSAAHVAVPRVGNPQQQAA